MKSSQIDIIYLEVKNSLGVTKSFATDFEEYYSKQIEELLQLTKQKDILILFVIDAFFQTYKIINHISYTQFIKDFDKYLLSSMSKTAEAKENIFSVINDNWLMQKTIDSQELLAFVVNYKQFDQTIFTDRQPIIDTTEIKKSIDIFIKKASEQYINIRFHTALVPCRIPFKYVISTQNLDKNTSILYWNICESININLVNYKEVYIKNLENLLSFTFLDNQKHILILFIFDGYYSFYSHMTEDYCLGIYENYQRDFKEYLVSALTNNNLSKENFFWQINHAWYNDPMGDVILSNNELVKNYTITARNLIDEYIIKLKEKHPEKVFHYMVLPEINHYKYIIL